MFDKTKFTYNEETHQGFYENALVPSVTQLIGVLYPLNENIKEETLKKAATRGTAIHNLVEEVNKLIIENGSLSNSEIDYYLNHETTEIRDYIYLLCAYNLKPVMAEKRVFLLDENGELICYGHFDFVCSCNQANILFNSGDLFLMDLKTTNKFDKKKTALQTQVYRVALEQNANVDLNGKTYGVWLRDGNANIYPFNYVENSKIIELMKKLREIWNGRN